MPEIGLDSGVGKLLYLKVAMGNEKSSFLA